MSNKNMIKVPKIVLINPPFADPSSGTAGIAYLRGYLEKIDVCYRYVNLNKEIMLSDPIKKDLYNFIIKETILNGVQLEEEELKKKSLIDLFGVLLNGSKNGKLYETIKKYTLVDRFLSKDLIKEEEYIGFSVSYHQQLVFSLLLAGYIKKYYLEKKIIFGGSLMYKKSSRC